MIAKLISFLLSVKIYGPVIIIISGSITFKIIQKLLMRANLRGKTDLEIKRRNTIVILISNIIRYFIVIVASIIILDIYGVDTTSLIAGLGVAGVVIGLAFQDALKDIISGVNIIMDNYYVVGDVIKYNVFEGTVISFGLKTTKIQSETGEVLTIANRNINAISNLSQKRPTIFFEISTSNDVKENTVKTIIDKIIKDISKYDYVDKDESVYLGINEIKSTSTKYSFKVKCNQGNEKKLKRNINKLLKDEFNFNKIELKD